MPSPGAIWRMRVNWFQLELAFEYVGGGPYENRAVLCRESGEFLLHSEYGDNFDEWPDDVDNEHEYLAIPRNRDLDLGQPLVFAFARDFLPDEHDEVWRIFAGRGRLCQVQGPAGSEEGSRAMAGVRERGDRAGPEALVRRERRRGRAGRPRAR